MHSAPTALIKVAPILFLFKSINSRGCARGRETHLDGQREEEEGGHEVEIGSVGEDIADGREVSHKALCILLVIDKIIDFLGAEEANQPSES